MRRTGTRITTPETAGEESSGPGGAQPGTIPGTTWVRATPRGVEAEQAPRPPVPGSGADLSSARYRQSTKLSLMAPTSNCTAPA